MICEFANTELVHVVMEHWPQHVTSVTSLAVVVVVVVCWVNTTV